MMCAGWWVAYLIGFMFSLWLNTAALFANLQSVTNAKYANAYYWGDMQMSFPLALILSLLWPLGTLVVFFATGCYEHGLRLRHLKIEDDRQ